jgi:hypothetical protein
VLQLRRLLWSKNRLKLTILAPKSTENCSSFLRKESTGHINCPFPIAVVASRAKIAWQVGNRRDAGDARVAYPRTFQALGSKEAAFMFSAAIC